MTLLLERLGLSNDANGAILEIHLFGPFRVETRDGQQLTPRSAKACALLALLASQPNLEHTRAWVQDKLWSDRGRDQATASLRQALSQMRRELGPAASALSVSRSRIGLIAGRVSIHDADPGTGAEFLEGMDVRDPEFEDWLRTERTRRAKATQAQTP